MYDCTSPEIISLSKWVSYVFSQLKFLFFDVFRFKEPSIREEQDTAFYIPNWYIWRATMQMKPMKWIIPCILYWSTWRNVNRHIQISIQVVTRDVYCIRRGSKALSKWYAKFWGIFSLYILRFEASVYWFRRPPILVTVARKIIVLCVELFSW